ncbi:unnamed protein product [Bursaphelenchus okinawaensis]|uniref:Uncharacterized protein n=1 Tax=Bursaphelenchus okinawaensis TaxID=465554 RepID=A0A811LQE4_9BILA|nr:unnamed protein product [Bursaphelenchus okinawaensis]CAG9126512.1 unnamed protein product [Bursaphelenchus okinawaensis]
MGAEAEKYLKDHLIPQLFEGLMTGLIYNKPERPVDFLENALTKIKNNPHLVVRWDTFVDAANLPAKTTFTETAKDEEEKKPKKKKEPEDEDQSPMEEEPDKHRKKSNARYSTTSLLSVNHHTKESRRPSRAPSLKPLASSRKSSKSPKSSKSSKKSKKGKKKPKKAVAKDTVSDASEAPPDVQESEPTSESDVSELASDASSAAD